MFRLIKTAAFLIKTKEKNASFTGILPFSSVKVGNIYLIIDIIFMNTKQFST